MAKTSKRSAKAPAAAAVLQLPCISVGQLFRARLMPLSLNLIYAACNTGEIECFRVRNKIVIPTAPLRRKLGMEATRGELTK